MVYPSLRSFLFFSLLRMCAKRRCCRLKARGLETWVVRREEVEEVDERVSGERAHPERSRDESSCVLCSIPTTNYARLRIDARSYLRVRTSCYARRSCATIWHSQNKGSTLETQLLNFVCRSSGEGTYVTDIFTNVSACLND